LGSIKPHRPIELDMEICNSKLFKRNGDLYIHITVQKEVTVPKPELTCKTIVIACDVGEATPLASVESWNKGKKRRKIQFHGGEIRNIRAHYNNLKKRMGRKKTKHAVKWIKNTWKTRKREK